MFFIFSDFIDLSLYRLYACFYFQEMQDLSFTYRNIKATDPDTGPGGLISYYMEVIIVAYFNIY